MAHKYPFPTPLPVLPNVYKVRVFGTADNKPVGNDFCWQLTPTTTHIDAASLASSVAAHWHLITSNVLHASYIGQSVGVYDLSTAGTPLVEVPLPSDAIGGRAGLIAPPGIALVLKHRLNVRKKTGHTYLGRLSVEDCDATFDQVSPTLQGLAQMGWNSLVTQVGLDMVLSGADPKVGVLSMVTNKVLAPRFLPIASSVALLPLGSQNRRRQR